jgi:hypothetical protein
MANAKLTKGTGAAALEKAVAFLKKSSAKKF